MLTYEKVLESATTEIKELVLNSVKKEILLKNELLKFENNIIKMIDFHILPIFKDVIEKNKAKIAKKIVELNINENMNDEDRQYEINVLINSLLSLWKKTILTAKMAIVISDGGKYLKSFNGLQNKNIYLKDKEKYQKNINSMNKKYNLENID